MDADFHSYCSQFPLDMECDDFVPDEVRMEGLQEGLFPISEESYIFQGERPMKEVAPWMLSTSEQLLQDQRMHKIMIPESYQYIPCETLRREAMKTVSYEKFI
jgi:hypothetical protein